jgi:co-chaperonin GroES (HSP10)
MKFEPSDGHILIKLFKRSEKSRGGILIVRNDKDADKDTNLAEVVAVHDKSKYAVKDVVLVRVFAGAWIDPEIMPDQEYVYRVISDDEILGKFPEEEQKTEMEVLSPNGLGILPPPVSPHAG